MAKKAKPLVSAVGHVRISTECLGALDELAHLISRRVLNEAFQAAAARQPGPSLTRVTAEDLRASVRTVIPSAIADLDNLLKPRETRHAARKRAS